MVSLADQRYSSLHPDLADENDSLSNLSDACIIGFGVLNAVLLLGAVSSLAPLPGNNGGSWWPIYVKEHYSPQTSQNLLDPYSFSHFSHGVIGFLINSLIGSDKGVGFVLTIASAVLWEILENTQFVIDLFRENSGPSEDYRGDSKINVIGDVLSCTFGYGLAVIISRSWGVWPSITWVLVTEVAMAYAFRDGLLLLAIQVLSPSKAINNWQLEILPEEFHNRRSYWALRRKSNLFSTMHLARKGNFQKLVSRMIELRNSTVVPENKF